MVKKLVISASLIMLTVSAFADNSANEAIAAACKPYLEQYGNTTVNPAQLPATAQTALNNCYQHNSCLSDTLSNPDNGVSNCVVKLQKLQANIAPGLVIVTPQQKVAAPPPPAHPFVIGAPQAPTTTQPTQAPTQPAAPPENTNQPLGISPQDQGTSLPAKQPTRGSTINWF